MAHPSIQWFRLHAPEYAAKTDAELTSAFALIETWIARFNLQGRQAEAIALLLAHTFRMADNAAAGQGGTTPVTGQRAGRVAIQYAQSTGNNGRISSYDLTPYGRLYQDLLDTRPLLTMMSTSMMFK